MGGLVMKSLSGCAFFVLFLSLFCICLILSFLTYVVSKTQIMMEPVKESHVMFRVGILA